MTPNALEPAPVAGIAIPIATLAIAGIATTQWFASGRLQ